MKHSPLTSRQRHAFTAGRVLFPSPPKHDARGICRHSRSLSPKTNAGQLLLPRLACSLQIALAFACGCGCSSVVADSGEDGTKTFSVVDFGAVPDDGLDDGPAVRKALQEARRLAKPTVFFPPGRYDFEPPGDGEVAILEVNDYPSLTIIGDGAELVGRGLKPLLSSRRCGELTVRGLRVDWDPLPFTAGEVVASDDKSCDVEIAAGHPLLEEPIVSIHSLEPETRAFVRQGQDNHYLLSQKAGGPKSEVIGTSVLRVFRVEKPDAFDAGRQQGPMPAAGTQVVAYFHVRGGGAFQVFNYGTLLFEDVHVFAAPGMGFMINNGEIGGTGTLKNCRVAPKPGSGRRLSTAADATHFAQNRGKIELLGCIFDGMGDDGTNVRASYSMVHERAGDNAVVVRGWTNPFVAPTGKPDFHGPVGQFRVGDKLEFSGPDRRHASAFEAEILRVADKPLEGHTLKVVHLDRPLPEFIGPGTILANATEVATFLMRKCVVRRARGQGARIKTRGAVVESSLFEDIQGNGVWIFCDADYGHESISARDVVIRDSVFRGVASAIRATAGRREPFDKNIHENILVEDCTLERCSSTPVVLHSVKGAVIRNNTFQINGDEPVESRFSSDVKIENNTILPPAGRGQFERADPGLEPALSELIIGVAVAGGDALVASGAQVPVALHEDGVESFIGQANLVSSGCGNGHFFTAS
jgi:hypothetical protein